MAAIEALNRLCKWRSVLAGWHAGTRSINQPGTQAMRDLMDKWLIMRVEMTAVNTLLLAKGVYTAVEYDAAMEAEAKLLDHDMETWFPGFRSTPDGMSIDPQLADQTMKRLGFPP